MVVPTKFTEEGAGFDVIPKSWITDEDETQLFCRREMVYELSICIRVLIFIICIIIFIIASFVIK